jgi:hypothetical protein
VRRLEQRDHFTTAHDGRHGDDGGARRDDPATRCRFPRAAALGRCLGERALEAGAHGIDPVVAVSPGADDRTEQSGGEHGGRHEERLPSVHGSDGLRRVRHASPATARVTTAPEATPTTHAPNAQRAPSVPRRAR